MKPHELSKETINNRKAAMALARDAAIGGDGIAGAMFELESAAHTVPGGGFIATTAQDFRDEDEDDDVRPF